MNSEELRYLFLILGLVVVYIIMAVKKSKKLFEERSKSTSKPQKAKDIPKMQRNNAIQKTVFNGETVPVFAGSGDSLKYPGFMSGSQAVLWQSKEKDSNGNPKTTRIPQESEKTFPKTVFYAAGKKYSDIKQLFAEKNGGLYKDMYGREVFYHCERFPCFDSDDFLYENRFFHHIYIKDNGKLTRIFTHDDLNEIYVAEDADRVLRTVKYKMKEIGFILEESK